MHHDIIVHLLITCDVPVLCKSHLSFQQLQKEVSVALTHIRKTLLKEMKYFDQALTAKVAKLWVKLKFVELIGSCS